MENLVGVECSSCHEEAFQLVEREITVKAKVCTRCARRIDSEAQSKADEEALKGMGKAERLRVKKENAHEWAHSWHGKHVEVSVYDWNDDQPYSREKTKVNQLRGMACYATKHEDVGWGRVKVILDDAELKRVSFKKSEYPDRHKVPFLDGEYFRFITHGYKEELDRPLAFFINWGDRNTMVMEEVDPEADRLAAVREEERLKKEQEEETARHAGEGI